MTTTENRATKRYDAICPDSLHNSRKRTIHSFIPYTAIRWTLFPYPFVPSFEEFLFSFFTFNFSINLLPLALSVSPIHSLIHIFPGCDDERVVFCSPGQTRIHTNLPIFFYREDKRYNLT